MSNKEFDLQKQLEDAVRDASPTMDKKEVVEMSFKMMIPRVLEMLLLNFPNGGRLPAQALAACRDNLIKEFRSANLGEHQRSVERYEVLFSETMKGILEECSSMTTGVDSIIEGQQQLSIDGAGYRNMVAPKFERRTPGGIILPN